MMTSGFSEAQARYLAGFGEASPMIGDVRRFGPTGPAYEVVDGVLNGEIMIEVVQSGERLSYPLADYLADPVAETVP